MDIHVYARLYVYTECANAYYCYCGGVVAAGVGGQNSTLISASGDTVSWETVWTWANNENNVKSCMCIFPFRTVIGTCYTEYINDTHACPGWLVG